MVKIMIILEVIKKVATIENILAILTIVKTILTIVSRMYNKCVINLKNILKKG